MVGCGNFILEKEALAAPELHSTNPLERLNGEIKRRNEVVGIFPNEDATDRLVGAILFEQNEPPRLCRRPQLLRGWRYDEQDDEQVLA